MVIKNLLKLCCGKGHLFDVFEMLGTLESSEFLELAAQQRDDLGKVQGR